MCCIAEGRRMKNDPKEQVVDLPGKTSCMFIALRVIPNLSCQQLVETLAQVMEIKADQLDNE